MRNTRLILVILFWVISPLHAQDTPLHLRFGNFSRTTEAEVYIDGEAGEIAPLGSGEVSEWLELSGGSHTVAFGADGEPVTVNGTGWKTVALTGENAIQIVDEDVSLLPEDESRVTLLQAVEGVDAVDVLLDGTLFYPDLSYGTSFSADIIASTYELSLQRSDNDALMDATVDELQLRAGYSTLIVVSGTADSPEVVTISAPLNASAAPTEEAQSNRALLRLAQLSSGTPPLDFYLNGELTDFSDVSFPEITGWLALPAGTYTLAVALSGESFAEAIVGPMEVTLAEGTYSTAAAIGTLANNTLAIHVFEEDFTELDDDAFRLGVLNAYPGSGAVDVVLDENAPVIDALGYPGFFGDNDGFSEVVVEQGTYDLQVLDGEQMLVTLSNNNFIPGRNYFIAVIAADPPFLLTFSDIGETTALMEGE